MNHFVHSILIVMFLNSFILFVAACMKTIPAEAASVVAQSDNIPLRRLPVLPAEDDYSAHIQQFRQAKTFKSTPETSDAGSASASASVSDGSDVSDFTVSDRLVENLRTANRETLKKNARTFAVVTDKRSENKENEESGPEPAVSNRDDNNNVHDDRDLFEALQVEKSGEPQTTMKDLQL
uniref:Secreted protein n=1 Tax=Caenorhabditis tropicalis TaxID=1561998 RepID=A0A1I7TE23_9PELO